MTPASVAVAPMATFGHIDKRDADSALVEWKHYLGASNRPFGRQDFGLSTPSLGLVAVAVSVSTVSPTAAGLPRKQVVELGRLVRHPDHPWATAACLRLWQSLAAPAWPYWPVTMAVSYCSLREHGAGGGKIYQLAGWRKHSVNKGSSGGGTWSKPATARSGGKKSLWTYQLGRQITAGAQRKAV